MRRAWTHGRAVKPVCAVLCPDARSELSAELSSAPVLFASVCASAAPHVSLFGEPLGSLLT